MDFGHLQLRDLFSLETGRCALGYYSATEEWTRLCHLKILYFIYIYLLKKT